MIAPGERKKHRQAEFSTFAMLVAWILFIHGIFLTLPDKDYLLIVVQDPSA